MPRDRQKRIVQLLKDSPRPLTPEQIAIKLGIHRLDTKGMVSPLLHTLVSEGKVEVTKDAYGRIKSRWYTWVK